MRRLTKILRCEEGANAIEYALVASLISIAASAAFHQLGDRIDDHVQQRFDYDALELTSEPLIVQAPTVI